MAGAIYLGSRYRSEGWTPERRKNQSEAIHRWKPWEKTTGPRTIKGDAVSNMNALKHGMRSAEQRKVLATRFSGIFP